MARSAQQRARRRQRQREALRLYKQLRDEMRFEQIDLVVHNDGRHWQFRFGQQLLVDYWPSAGRCQIGGGASQPCNGPTHAGRRAIRQKRAIMERIRAALQATPIS